MEYILTGTQMKEADAYTIEEIGILSLVLMENAARSMADIVEQNIGKKTLIVCGVGNNGADGLCIYRILKIHGYDCDCVIVGDEKKATREYLAQKKILNQLKFTYSYAESWCMDDTAKYDVILDAIFGVGLTRDITNPVFLEMIHQINASNAYVYAVDIPSGISAEDGHICGCAVLANGTVTFGYKKIGMLCYPGKEWCGKIHVADIGYPQSICEQLKFQTIAFTKEDFFKIPKRRKDGNKGTFRKVLMIAGSKQYCGAAVLATDAAYKMGAGMVKVVTHEKNRIPIFTDIPESLALFYGDIEDAEEHFFAEFEKSMQWADTIVIGPGLSQCDLAVKMTTYILKNEKEKRVILDADALNLIATRQELKEELNYNMVITPHLLEMSRLTGISADVIKENRQKVAVDFAKNYHCVVVLKDATTIVTDGETVFYNTTGNSGMATAGSGDVLAGILGTAATWELSLSELAMLAVYIHGTAGDKAAKKYGENSMTAKSISGQLSFLKKYQR